MSSDQGTITDILTVKKTNTQNNILQMTGENKQLKLVQLIAIWHKSHNCVDVDNNRPTNGVCDSSCRAMTLLKIHKHCIILL